MRNPFLSLIAVLALVPAASSAGPTATTPLGTEVLAFEAALNEGAVGRGPARDTWVQGVQAARTPQALAAAVAGLEGRMGWDKVEATWKARRTGWVAEAQRAASMGAAARLLLELESQTRWSAVRATWKTDRDGWVRRVTALASVAPAPAPAAAAAGAPPAAGVSPEMAAFLAPFNGDYKAVKASLKTHGAAGLDDQDMGVMNLERPRVTASETKGGRQCYTFEAAAGIMVRTYGVCWAGGRIVAVEDKGMR